GLATNDILAVGEAANIMAALAARSHGRRAGRAASSDRLDPPVETRHAFASERTRLVLTARALSSPLVGDVLRSVTAAPHPDSTGTPPEALSPVATAPGQQAGSGR